MMFGLFTKLFKKKIKYHEISKFLKPNDLFFDIGAHIGDKSKEFYLCVKVKKNPVEQCSNKIFGIF